MAHQFEDMNVELFPFESTSDHRDEFKGIIDNLLQVPAKNDMLDFEMQDVEVMKQDFFKPSATLLSSVAYEGATGNCEEFVYQALQDVKQKHIIGYLLLGKDSIKVKMHSRHFLTRNKDPLLSGGRIGEDNPLPVQLQWPLKTYSEDEIKKMVGGHFPQFMETELPQTYELLCDHWKKQDMKVPDKTVAGVSKSSKINEFPNVETSINVEIPMSSETNELKQEPAKQQDAMWRKKPRKSNLMSIY